MLFKQDGQLDESGAFDQWFVGRFHTRTNHRVKHPRWHAASGLIGKPHINHISLASS